MKTANFLYGLAAATLLGGFSAAQAAHLPSPCGAGETGAGTNCMYLVASGASVVQQSYDGLSGNREAGVTSLTFGIDVWMDFGTQAVQGGGFDVLMDMTNVSTLSWTWGADFNAGEQTLDGAQTANGYEGIQFDDFAGNGYGGTTGTQSGFALVGTLSVTLTAAADNLLMQIAQPYGTGTFPNCFAPGAGSGGSGCTATNFYDITVSQVPLPAAVWMMLAGIGSLAGFSRRKVA